MKNLKYKILFVSLLMILSQQGISQDLIRTNPADITDPQALFINPALLPYQNLSFNLGMKIYHIGFLEDNSVGLRHSYSSNSFPNVLLNGVGVGVTFQNFDSPYHTDNGIGISLGYSIKPSFSLGFSVQGSNFHLDKDKLGPLELNDPLLASRLGKWYFSYGAGLLIRPSDRFRAGLSLNNINRPSKSFEQDNAEERNRVPFVIDFGASYQLNNIFGVSVFSHLQKNEFAPGVAIEAKIDVENEGIIKAGYVDRGLMFQGQVKISDGLGIIYRLDYPFSEVNKVSYGSHQLGLSWNMKFNPDYTFNIQTSEDTVRVVTEYTKISIKRQNLDTLFARLDDIDLIFPNSKTTEDIPVVSSISSGMSLDDIGGSLPHNTHLDAYKDNFLEIRNYIKSVNKDFTLYIYYPDATTAERAWVIKKYLIDSLQFKENNIKLLREANGKSHFGLNGTVKDSIRVLFDMSPDRYSNSKYIEITSPTNEKMVPDKIFFHITNVKLSRVAKWRILITNFLEEPIHEIFGVQNIENVVEWDGFNNDGKPLDIGNYYYQFQYSENVGNNWLPQNPKRNRLVFIRVKSEKAIEITSGAINDVAMLREVIIRLKEPINGATK